jgi:hypothetical protein
MGVKVINPIDWHEKLALSISKSLDCSYNQAKEIMEENKDLVEECFKNGLPPFYSTLKILK